MPGEWEAHRFVEARNVDTGRLEVIPADWVGHPVLGKPFEVVQAPEPVDPADVPTEKNTVAEIDAFADEHGIDLGDASTKAEKVAVIAEAVTAAPAAEEPVGNPDVQLVYGDESDVSPYPAVEAARQAQLQAAHNTTDDTGSSDENPDAGDEEK